MFLIHIIIKRNSSPRFLIDRLNLLASFTDHKPNHRIHNKMRELYNPILGLRLFHPHLILNNLIKHRLHPFNRLIVSFDKNISISAAMRLFGGNLHLSRAGLNLQLLDRLSSFSDHQTDAVLRDWNHNGVLT